MWRHGPLLAALVVLAVGAPAASGRAVRPRAFVSCDALVDYGRRHLAQTQGVAQPSVRPLPAPVVIPSPSPPTSGNGTATLQAAAPASDATTVSTTNNQEDGVD